MGSSFGERLKEERVSRNLTLDALGGTQFTANYIDLLEKAHREPTTDVIHQLASLLQTAHQNTASNGASICGDEESLRLSLRALQSWDTRDYTDSAACAQAAAGRAKAAHAESAEWHMNFLAARAFLRDGRPDDAVPVLESLLKHPMTLADETLAQRSHQNMAAVMLCQGNLTEAIAHAGKAVAIGSGDSEEDFTAYLISLQTLIGALTEAGQLDDAWTYAQTLANSVKADTAAQVAGEIHWVIGNVAFIRQDVSTGLEHHSKAARLLSPTEDLSRWAQFNKATAWVRLSAGIIEPATLQAIERSELAHSVVGANLAETLEVVLLRARWNFLNGALDEALELLAEVEAQTDQLAPHIAGDSALLLGDTLLACQRPTEAREAYQQAQQRYAQAGATDRAAVAQEHLAAL